MRARKKEKEKEKEEEETIDEEMTQNRTQEGGGERK